jgi:hypothetical protein
MIKEGNMRSPYSRRGYERVVCPLAGGGGGGGEICMKSPFCCPLMPPGLCFIIIEVIPEYHPPTPRHLATHNLNVEGRAVFNILGVAHRIPILPVARTVRILHTHIYFSN